MPLRFPLSAPTAPLALSARATSISTARPFTTSMRRWIKEDADRSPDEVEAKKQEQLKKQQKGEGHWHEGLASQGESNIAADREKVHDHDEHMEDLQKEGASQSEKEKESGKR